MKRRTDNGGGMNMRFEIGKYYKHTTGEMLHILGLLDTTIYGNNVLIAEVARGGCNCGLEPGRDDPILPEQQAQPCCNHYETFMAVGQSEDSATNYYESTEEEWMKNFS